MVKLICYNIEYCEGILGHWYEYLKIWRIFFPPKGLDQKIVSEFKKLKPDILALVEVDTGSFRAKSNKANFFKKNLSMISIAKKVKYPIEGWMSLMQHLPILNKHANAILGKYKFHNVHYHFFNKGVKRVAIETTIMCPKKVSIVLCHLSLGRKTRKEQIDELIKIVNSIKNPVMLMGDFNTFKGEDELTKLLGNTSLKDTSRLKNPTYPAWNPKRRLDYVLTSSNIKVKQYKVLNYEFSDHRPLFVEFKVK
ncbi:MAG: endonuclease/exonuclease/phosphatase family protein [archaeon]